MPLWVFSGVSGSGKTTLGLRLAARLACPFLDADAFHSPANIAKMRSGTPLDERDREAWLEALCRGVEVLDGAEAVLAFPGLKKAHRERLLKTRPDVRFACLRAEVELIERRLKDRGGFFPATLAQSQFRDWEPDPDAFDLDARLSLDELEAKAYAWARPGGGA